MFQDSFPKELNSDLQKVIEIIPKKTYNNVYIESEDTIEYYINNGVIKIPYRMYLIDINFSKINNLTYIQKEILYCIYTRSCDGYIREKYLNELLKLNFDYWAIPFIVKLSDEYIVEILEVIYDKLINRNNDDIRKFCLENKNIINKGYYRMTSYWNEAYRNGEPYFQNYVGRKLFRDCFGYNRTFEK